MAKSPPFPVSNKADYNPFLNDGQTKVEFVEGTVKDGPPDNPIPAYTFDLKVIESANPMNVVGQTHTVRVKCRGFSWGETVKEIVGAAGTLPKQAISPEVAESLFAAGKLKGRKFIIEQTTKTATSGATFREYKCAPLEPKPAL